MYVEKLKSEEDITIEDTINKYSKYLQTIVINQTKNKFSIEDVEEIIADTFFIFWRNKEKFDKTREVKFYLSGIAKNLIKEKFRKLKIDYNLENYENVLLDKKNVSSIYENLEIQRSIERELEKLSVQDKEIFILFYYNSKKIKEIAKQLGISDFIVKSRLYRIRKKLKKELERQGYSYGE